jgi:hypothetical protein
MQRALDVTPIVDGASNRGDEPVGRVDRGAGAVFVRHDADRGAANCERALLAPTMRNRLEHRRNGRCSRRFREKYSR